MKLKPNRSLYLLSTALGLSLAAYSAHANPALPGLTNLDFLSYSGSNPKDTFTHVNPTGWTGGNGLIYIDTPGNSSNPNSACGATYLSTYGCPSTLPIAGGYNYVEADGNPIYESGFNTTVKGLTVGQTYTLSFYQAASQQKTFDGATTNQWVVALGSTGSSLYTTHLHYDYGTGSWVDKYKDTDSLASISTTTLMNVPNHGLVDWNYVSVDLTAHATTETLSFLAWGNNGNTANEPPIAFLTGVDAPPNLTSSPEPASLALFGVGLAGLGGIARRRRAKRSPSN